MATDWGDIGKHHTPMGVHSARLEGYLVGHKAPGKESDLLKVSLQNLRMTKDKIHFCPHENEKKKSHVSLAVFDKPKRNRNYKFRGWGIAQWVRCWPCMQLTRI